MIKVYIILKKADKQNNLEKMLDNNDVCFNLIEIDQVLLHELTEQSQLLSACKHHSKDHSKN